MPDKVPCENCPWVARGKRLAAAGQPQEERHRVACGGWRACDEDGGTCWGAVRFTQSDAAAAYREPIPAVARQQGPDTPDHTPTTVKPTTTVDFVSAESKDV